ncbi:MAG: hypothetical protein U1E55_10570 [Paracoccus sp. (in: a-proteobacteria)]
MTFQLSKQVIEAIDKAIDEGDGTALDTLEPTCADIADLIEQPNPSRRREFLKLYSGEIDGDILSEIDEERARRCRTAAARCWPRPCAKWTATMSSIWSRTWTHPSARKSCRRWTDPTYMIEQSLTYPNIPPAA